MSTGRTWLVMVRDLSHQFTVADNPGFVVSLVLDVDTGLVLGFGLADTGGPACKDAMAKALTQPVPSAPFPPGPPSRVATPPHAADDVRTGLREVIGDGAPEVEVMVPGQEAEDILDSLVGHLAGRAQPADAPEPDDAGLLMSRLHDYARRQPWQQLSGDHDNLTPDVTLDGQHDTFTGYVLGQDGIQTGLVLHPEHAAGGPVPTWQPDEDVEVPVGSILCYLEPRDEVPGDALDRAIRYGWPPDANLFPIVAVITDDGMGDLGRRETRTLTIGADAVLAYLDADPGKAETNGYVTFSDGRRADFTIGPRPAESQEDIVRRAVASGDMSEIMSLVGMFSPAPDPFARAERPTYRKPRRDDVVTYRVRVDLQGAKPPCWRRLELASDLMLDDVHRILQIAFGWTDSHLHKFAIGGAGFYDRNSEEFLTPYDLADGEVGTPETDIRIDETLAEPGDKLYYLYDFGDDWKHVVKLEAVMERKPGDPVAVCTTGRRPSPAEDCGGMSGYELWADANDPASKYHDDALATLKDWYGEDVSPTDFAPRAFDIDDINKQLR